ncbi:uncharacterized protein METZ01_LOCUS303374 [marine metagenome]|uniref:Uncharacterized protein n=1 Tax=marine metagenome TaxID=408172 RepID=A0A382MPI8_9ZZZZ
MSALGFVVVNEADLLDSVIAPSV